MIRLQEEKSSQEKIDRYTKIVANYDNKELIRQLEFIAVQNDHQGYGQSEPMLQILRAELLKRMS